MKTRGSTLVGRDGEVERVVGAIEASAKGRGRFVLIEGEAGIGKTSLLHEVIGSAGRTLFGAAFELEQDRPFGLIATALRGDGDGDPRAVGLAQVLSGQRSEAQRLEPAQRFQLVDEIVDLFEEMSFREPLVVALEDLHWADASSLVVLHVLIRRLSLMPVCVLATARPVPRSTELDRISRAVQETGGERISLGALDTEATRSVVENIVGAPPAPGLLKQVESAAGNPLYITELTHTFQREGAIRIENDMAAVDEVGVPASLRLTIIRTLSYLSRATLDVLRNASVLGSSFDVAELSALHGSSTVELLPAIAEACEANVLREEGEHMAFRHELVREAVYLDLPLGVRKALHAQAGAMLADAGAPASRVAKHLFLGSSPGDERAVAWLLRAAREAIHRDPEVSVELLRRALELTNASSPQHPDLLVYFLMALMFAGHPAEAERAADRALAAGLGQEQEFRVHFLLQGSLVQQGRTAEAAERMDVLAQRPDLPDAILGRVLASRSGARSFSGRIGDAIRDAHEALAIGERAGADFVVSHACHTLATIAHWSGDLDKAIELSRRGLRDGPKGTWEPGKPPDQRGLLNQTLGLALSDADRFDEAERAFADRRHADGGQDLWPLHFAAQAIKHYRAGEWDDALVDLHAGLAASEGDRSPYGRPLACVWLGRIGLHREDRELASRARSQIESDLADGIAQGWEVAGCIWVQALLQEWTGDAERARGLLEDVWSRLRHAGIGVMGTIAPDHIRHQLAAGNHREAAEAADLMEKTAARAGTFASARGVALRCRGLAEDEVETLLQAVAAYRESPRPVELASACEDAGSALARAGRTDEAITLLREALEGFDAVSAVHDTRRIDSQLRSLGVRRGQTGQRRRPSTGWEALTPTEGRVVDLVCEGLTNRRVGERLFISPRTVDTHMVHIFQKLGVGSRTELVSFAGGRS